MGSQLLEPFPLSGAGQPFFVQLPYIVPENGDPFKILHPSVSRELVGSWFLSGGAGLCRTSRWEVRIRGRWEVRRKQRRPTTVVADHLVLKAALAFPFPFRPRSAEKSGV